MTTPPTTQTIDLALASRLRLAITRTARRLRQEADAHLTPSQVAALATIEKRGPLTPSELADIERIQRPTATRVAGHLTGRGLVERAGDPGDGRVSLLSITDEGHALLEEVRSRKNAYLADRMSDLSAADRAALERAADLLEHMLEDQPR
jgi:DNA-binding MarR family transcriptional regulator